MDSSRKAERFQVWAEEAGWSTVLEDEGDDRVSVTCSKDGQQIYIWWQNNALTEGPRYTFGGIDKSLHNQAGAKRQLTAKPDWSKASKKQRKQESKIEDSGTDEPEESFEESIVMSTTLPFSMEDSDEDVITVLWGRSITFVNSINKAIESEPISKEKNKYSDVCNLTTTSSGRRIINFVCPSGFRSVGLDAIVQVG